MIRPFFIYHPEFRGKVCRAAFETVQGMMSEADAVPLFRDGALFDEGSGSALEDGF